MTAPPRLTLAFPAYNEAENVESCLELARAAVTALGIAEWEVLFVDDGSDDGTSSVIERAANGDPRVRVVRHDRNRGYGAAVRSAIAHATYEWLFITDADLQFAIRDLALLLPLTSSCTFIQGYRLHRADPVGRVLLGRVFRALAHAVAPVPVRDPECSFRLVRTAILTGLPIVSRGPLVPIELVVRAARAGATFGEVGVLHRRRERGESKALTVASLGMMASDLARILAASVAR